MISHVLLPPRSNNVFLRSTSARRPRNILLIAFAPHRQSSPSSQQSHTNTMPRNDATKHTIAEKATPRRGDKQKRSKIDERPCRSSSRSRNHRSSANFDNTELNISTRGTRSKLCFEALPQPPNHFWVSCRSIDVTCLSFGLDPGQEDHKKIICQKCMNFYDVVLKNILVHKE